MKISFGSYEDILSTTQHAEGALARNDKWVDLMGKVGSFVDIAKAISEVSHDTLSFESPDSKFPSRLMGLRKQC
jgi:hypothetical protein